MIDSAALLNDVQRTQCRFSWLCYRFRASRFVWTRLAAALRAQCRRRGIALPAADIPDFPVYVTTRSSSGVMRLVRAHRISGGAGRPLLRCWTESEREAVVLHAEGEVDLSTAPMLGEAIAKAYCGKPGVIVDINGLTYLDGSGIRILEAAARAHPARFVVVGSKRELHRLFEILGVVNALPVVSSIAAAREYLSLQ